MRAVVQRVSRAQVGVAGETVGKIGCGLLILLGVGTGDGLKECVWLADRVAKLRIFPDDAGRIALVGAGGRVSRVRPVQRWQGPWWISLSKSWWRWGCRFKRECLARTCRLSW